jgi:hypothetical protein
MPRRPAATLVLVALLALVSSHPVYAGSVAQQTAVQPAASPPGSPGSPRGWQFDDEEEKAPGWREVVGA